MVRLGALLPAFVILFHTTIRVDIVSIDALHTLSVIFTASKRVILDLPQTAEVRVLGGSLSRTLVVDRGFIHEFPLMVVDMNVVLGGPVARVGGINVLQGEESNEAVGIDIGCHDVMREIVFIPVSMVIFHGVVFLVVLLPNSNQGVEIGVELFVYFRMEIDLIRRGEGENVDQFMQNGAQILIVHFLIFQVQLHFFEIDVDLSELRHPEVSPLMLFSQTGKGAGKDGNFAIENRHVNHQICMVLPIHHIGEVLRLQFKAV